MKAQVICYGCYVRSADENVGGSVVDTLVVLFFLSKSSWRPMPPAERSVLDVIFLTTRTLGRGRQVDHPANQKLVPRLPRRQSSQQLYEQQQRAATKVSSKQYCVNLSAILLGSMALLGICFCSWPSRRASLSQASNAIASPSPVWHASTTFEAARRGATALRPFAAARLSRCCCCCCC